MSASDHDPTTRAGRARARRESVWRHYGFTALGTLVPGAGLTAAGRRWLGGALLLLTALGIAVAIYVVVKYGLVSSALNLAVRPNLLRALSIGIALAAVIWCASIVVTSWATRPQHVSGIQKGLTGAFTTLMCLVILAPSVQLVRYLNIQRDVVGTVFSGRHEAPSADSVTQAGPEVTRADPWANTPRVNFLLLGSDSGKGREGTRTDSMIVASINTRNGDTVLFGVPRNLENVPFPRHDPLNALYPNGYNCGNQCLMNAVWTLAEGHRDLFPGDKNPGLTATKDALSEVLGLRIDYTTIIDLNGFQALVNAMGGVDINVTERIPIGGKVTETGRVVGITGWIEVGRQHMDGYHALWYSRSRATTDDYNRMGRQRCMVGALVDQVNPVAMLQRFPALAAVAKQNIQVDIAQDELPAWVELVQRMQNAKIRSLPLTPKNISVTHPNFAKIHAMVRSAIAEKPPSPSNTATTTQTPSKTGSTPTPKPSSPAGSDKPVEISQAC